MNQGIKAQWSENVIVVDAEYIDRVAFNLIVNFGLTAWHWMAG